jgi:hypothetical protein
LFATAAVDAAPSDDVLPRLRENVEANAAAVAAGTVCEARVIARL